MSARAPQRRKITARELAEQIGSSTRTAQRLIAEPRAEFEQRARARRDQAVELRAQGLLLREIAEQMQTTVGAVGGLLDRARKDLVGDSIAEMAS